MRTSYLPKKLAVFYSVFLLGSFLISGCTSPTLTPSTKAQRHGSAAPFIININTAGIKDLEKLPRVGRVLAGKIIDHRNRYGPFRKPEHLLIVEGISEQRFRELRQFINTE
jgi:competence ComEA-like helix-hairpin-helix protein